MLEHRNQKLDGSDSGFPSDCVERGLSFHSNGCSRELTGQPGDGLFHSPGAEKTNERETLLAHEKYLAGIYSQWNYRGDKCFVSLHVQDLPLGGCLHPWKRCWHLTSCCQEPCEGGDAKRITGET